MIGEKRLTAADKKISLSCKLFSAKENLYPSLPLQSVYKTKCTVLTGICNPTGLSHSFFLTLILTMDSCQNSESSSFGEELISFFLFLKDFIYLTEKDSERGNTSRGGTKRVFERLSTHIH